MFRDSEEMFKTMEELTNLQMEGSDVYMSAFSGLEEIRLLQGTAQLVHPFLS